MSFYLEHAVKGVAAGIGLASESIHVRKEKKKKNQDKEASSISTGYDSEHSSEVAITKQSENEMPPQYQQDEELYDLDDAQEELVPQPKSAKKTRDIKVIVDTFTAKYPTPTAGGYQNLEMPVILPQRRPNSRSRGFVRGYAPILEGNGIDQAMFLDFLETFDQAAAASPFLNYINLASFAGFAMSPFGGVLLNIGVMVTKMVAEEMNARARTMSFLDLINDHFFRPRGLYCLVMTWNPDSPDSRGTINLNSTISSVLESQKSGMKATMNKFKTSNANTYGDFEFPETAPLIFPALDDLASHTSEEKMNKLKKTTNFVGDYMDRRARANYMGKHPESFLANGPQEKFTSRYADPNHPATSGNIVSLVTGGYVNPPPMTYILGMDRGRRPKGYYGVGGKRLANYKAQSDSNIASASDTNQNQRQAMNMQRGGYGYGYGSGRGATVPGAIIEYGKKGAAKLLGWNVLYLMIVNMPSEEEMAAAMNPPKQEGSQ